MRLGHRRATIDRHDDVARLERNSRVLRRLEDEYAGLGPEVKWRESPKKSAPRIKTQERLKGVAEGAKAPAAEAPAAAPAATAPAAPAEEKPAA